MIHIFKNILLYFLFFGSLYSDECTNNISIQENYFNEDIIGYYLSAIDLESGQSNVLLFDYSIDMTNALSSTECYYCPPEYVANQCDTYLNISGADPSETHAITQLWFDFEISMYVPSIEGFSDGPQSLVEGTVRLDNIPNNLSQLSFRNTDLNLDTQNLQGGTTFHLENHTISIDDTDITNLTEILLSHGRLPNGIYYFSFFLRDNEGNGIDQLTKEIEVFVPSYLDLIIPGSSSISDTLSNVIMTTNPIFQWNSDYCNNCELAIRVAEYRLQDHSSLSEAIEDYSVLPIESGFHYIDPNSNIFQYPFSNVGNLINGKIYVWQLLRTFVTTSGTAEEFSNVYVFKIQSLETEIETSISNNENFENLRLLIGDQKYNEFFGLDGQLNDFVDMNNVITINGQTMSVNYLIELINKLNDGQINILEVEIE